MIENRLDRLLTMNFVQECNQALTALIGLGRSPSLIVWSSVAPDQRERILHQIPDSGFQCEANQEEILSSMASLENHSKADMENILLFVHGESQITPLQENLLACIRDQHSLPVISFINANREKTASSTTKRLSALGFQKNAELSGKACNAYQFDIDNYKNTPDWLNANQWANPELWDKHRW